MVAAEGWSVGNVDCSVVCEEPKLAPRRDEMERNLSAAAGAPVTVKGRRAEGLGALGRREGIACWAVAVVERTSMKPGRSSGGKANKRVAAPEAAAARRTKPAKRSRRAPGSRRVAPAARAASTPDG